MTLPFENNTGKVIKRLASGSMKSDRRRNLFVIVTIALAAALMAAIFCTGAGNDRKLEKDIRGQYQAVVVNCDRDTIERLKVCPEVERWGLSQSYGSARYGDSVLAVEYADANWMELGKKPPFTGTLPQAANEILAERAFLRYIEIPKEIGQTIEMDLGNGKRTYTVSGIMDVENDSRMFQLYVSEAFVEEMAQGEPLFEFRLRYTGADNMELEQLKADIGEFLLANDVAEDQILYSSNYFDMQGFKSGLMKYYIPVAVLLLAACVLTVFLSIHAPVRMASRVSSIEAVRSSGYETATDRKDRKNHRITPFSMAKMNFQRNRKKTIITLTSLGLTGILLVAAATVFNSISPENMAAESMGDGCNYSVSWQDSVSYEEIPQTERNNPLTEELRQRLLALDGVESITPHWTTSASIKLPAKEETFSIQIFDGELMQKWLPEKEMEEGTSECEQLAEKDGIIITDASDHLLKMYYDYTPALGDVLDLKTMEGKTVQATVMGIAKSDVSSGTGIGALFATTDTLAKKLYPDIENMETLWNIHTSQDSDRLRSEIFDSLEDSLLTIISREDRSAAFAVSLQELTRGVYLLLAFLLVFSMVNLVNTLMTNLLARQQELGIMQSVGMSGKQMACMLIAECLWYAGVTVLLSVGIGGIWGWVLAHVLSGFHIFGKLSYQFPLMETIVFVMALLLVTGMFSVTAVRCSKRLSLVERIKTME